MPSSQWRFKGPSTQRTNLGSSLLAEKNAGAGDITMDQFVGFQVFNPTKNLRLLSIGFVLRKMINIPGQ